MYARNPMSPGSVVDVVGACAAAAVASDASPKAKPAASNRNRGIARALS
jgi:hypothetical protein